MGGAWGAGGCAQLAACPADALGCEAAGLGDGWQVRNPCRVALHRAQGCLRRGLSGGFGHMTAGVGLRMES